MTGVADLIILAGVPGSGKTTWAKSLLSHKYAIVSSAAGSEKPKDLSVLETFHREIAYNLQVGVDVVADATFLSASSRAIAREIAENYRARVHLVMFKNVHQAVDRNNARDEETRVPEAVMGHMLEKYFDTLVDIVDEPYASVLAVESYT